MVGLKKWAESHMNNSVARKNLEVEITRTLTAADLADLSAPRGVVSRPIQKVSERHHLLARLVAQGFRNKEIAEQTGYTHSRISILKSDPTFQELVAVYLTKVNEYRDGLLRDHYAQLTALHADAAEEMHDRIMDTPELVSYDQLLDTVKFTGPVVGLAPVHKTQNLNVNLDLAGQVAAGRQRAGQQSAATAAKPAPVVLPLPGPVAEDKDD